MSEQTFDLIVIGGGPGGYVAAIRAAQLGLKTACVEREHLGGICLNWGCIPTKALLRSAEIFHNIRHAEQFGLSVQGVSFDVKKVVDRSRKVAKQLSGGVAHLLKKNKVTVVDGFGCLAGMAGTTLFFRNYYTAIPRELVNAARIDGAGFWRIFWRIVLPMSTPIMMVTLIWQFTNIWNDFLFGVAFSGADSKPVTVGLNNMANTTSSVKNYNVDMAAAIIAGLPTMLVYILAGQYFVKGLTAGAVKG